MNVINTDPVLALIMASHTSAAMATEELSSLAKEQKASNNLLRQLRDFENSLRKCRDDHKITREEIENLKGAAESLNAQGVKVDIESFLQTLEEGLHVASGVAKDGSTPEGGVPVHEGYETQAHDYLWENKDAEHDHMKNNAKTLDNIKEAINDAKENVKGEAANRELDIQRLTQEVSSATQLQSNLSKRWSDVGNQIISNMRA